MTMNMEGVVRKCVVSVAFIGLLAAASTAFAQGAETAGIVGVVQDTLGGVLPGVTVEAASPALIEKVRTVVTDSQGVYNIIDLRPGVYSVTFTLQGFSTLRREEIRLASGFTATVNAELPLGTLEQVITVSGAAPVVDLRNVHQQRQLARETLDVLPVTNSSTSSFAPLMPAAVLSTATVQDVGGNQSQQGAQFRVHGGPGVKRYFGGLPLNNTTGDGTVGPIVSNHASTEEVILQTANMADTETGGVQMNIIPKEGGNAFSGYGFAAYASGALQSDNRTDALRARGLTTDPTIRRTYDYAGALGGPIKRDELWFYWANRQWGFTNPVPGNYYNATQGTPFYTPDLSRPALLDTYYRDHSVRFTWQASRNQKLSIHYGYQPACNCFYGLTGSFAPEATHLRKYLTTMPQVSWTYSASSHLLFEAGFQRLRYRADGRPVEGVSPNDIHITELSTNYQYGSLANGLTCTGAYGEKGGEVYTGRFAMSYVPGSHAVKVGLLVEGVAINEDNRINQAMTYTFRNQVPQAVTLWAQPHSNNERVWPKLGIYAQDQWIVKRRLTLNYGVRFDSVDAYVPANDFPAGPFVDARSFGRVPDVPSWRDISPRLGVAYELFGNGKTAVKAYLGRFMAEVQGNYARLANPTNTTVNSTTRTWSDANGNFVPDCALRSPVANGECGAVDFSSFGQARRVTQFDDDLMRGWGRRGYNWQGNVSIQQEIAPNIGVNVGYFRSQYANFMATDNLEWTPADFDEYCITAPVDARLAGGGFPICGLYDVTPAKFGRTNNLVTRASNLGKQIQVYNGMEFTINAHWAQGAQLSGGLATGRTVTDNCAVLVDSPQKRFCRVTMPFAGATQVKLFGSYPLPWGLRSSAVYQNLAGIPITASYVATNAEVAPSLGRNLAAGARGTATVELIEPNTLREARITQIDIRLSRIFRIGATRVTGSLDVLNALNANSILAINTRYGPLWLQPQTILPGRLLKVVVQFDF